MNPFESFRLLVANAEVKDTLEKIKNYATENKVQESHNYIKLLSISSRFEKYRSDDIKGLLRAEEKGVQFNNIVNDILFLIEDIENESIKNINRNSNIDTDPNYIDAINRFSCPRINKNQYDKNHPKSVLMYEFFSHCGMVKEINENSLFAIQVDDLNKEPEVEPLCEGNENVLISQKSILSNKNFIFCLADSKNTNAIGAKLFAKSLKNEIISDLTYSGKSNQINLPNAFYHCLHVAHVTLLKKSKQLSLSNGLPTCFILSWIFNKVAHVYYSGNCRFYLYRNGYGFIHKSKPHTIVQERIDRGEITEYIANLAFGGEHTITKSLGGLTQELPVPEIDYFNVPLENHDKILVCTQGLVEMLTEELILSIFEGGYDDDLISDFLMHNFLEHGGKGNASAFVIRL